MKRLILSSLLACLFALPAFAEDAPPAKHPEGGKNHPCHQLMQTCEKAGFVKGGAKEGKGLFVNCMQPIMEGKTVAGVAADPSTVQACKEKKDMHPGWGRKGKGKGHDKEKVETEIEIKKDEK